MEEICLYNKYGYCKYGEQCKLPHEDRTCTLTNCERRKCKFRHPKIFKYFAQKGTCKFEEKCKFLHYEHSNDTRRRIEDLMNEILMLKEDMGVLKHEKNQKDQENEILQGKLSEKIEHFEEQNKKFQSEIINLTERNKS